MGTLKKNDRYDRKHVEIGKIQTKKTPDGTPPKSENIDIAHNIDIAQEKTKYIPETNVEIKINLCDKKPRNGAVFDIKFKTRKTGNKITIKNGDDSDVIAILKRGVNSKSVVTFFVEKGREASVTGIPDGVYFLQYAAGNAMEKNCKSFVDPVAYEFVDRLSYNTIITKTKKVVRTKYNIWTFTLIEVPYGNANKKNIDAAEFGKE